MAESIPRSHSRASIPRSQSEVGPGIGALKADEARTVLEDAPVYAASRDPDKNYPYEVLESPVILKEVKDLWLQRRENIERICTHLEQPVPHDAADLLDSFAAIRIRSLPKPGRLGRGVSHKQQTAILIAIGALNGSNGLFLDGVEMKSGQDICVNGGEELWFSGNGGGLAVLLFLNLA